MSLRPCSQREKVYKCGFISESDKTEKTCAFKNCTTYLYINVLGSVYTEILSYNHTKHPALVSVAASD